MSTFIFIIVIILLWQALYHFGVDVLEVVKAYAVPSPVGVGQCFARLFTEGKLLASTGYSLFRCVGGFLIAVGIGTIIGLLINRFRFFEKNLKPVILGLQTLPSVCWVPFSILWFGLTTRAILFVVVMGSAFSISISVDNAFRNIEPIYQKSALTMGATKAQLYLHVIFPAALPELIAGLKQGWSFAWRALMAGEVMTTSLGLGQMLITGRNLADINQVTTVMLLIVVIGVVIEKCFFSAIEKRILRNRGLLKST